MTGEVSRTEFVALAGAFATLQAAFNVQAKQLDELEARVGNHTENINLLRGDQQRQHTADLTLAGPTGQPVGAYGLIPAALPDNSTPAVVEGASAPVAVEGAAAAVIDTSDPGVNPGELAAATAAAVAAGLAPPTPVEQLSPAAIAAEEAIRRRAEQSQERREKRKAGGR